MITQEWTWAQTIGHDSRGGAPGTPPAQSNLMSSSQNTFQTNRISSLLAPGSDADARLETRAILAYLITKELEREFEGSEKLLVLANSAPACATTLYNELQQLPTEQRAGIKNLTEKVSFDPRSYQHHITKVYKDFVSNTAHFEPGKPSFGVLMCMIVYLVELCRRFLDNNKGQEIPSIHKHATLLMLDPESLLAPANWTEYLEAHPPKQRPVLERRPSLAADAAALVFYMVEAYTKYTK